LSAYHRPQDLNDALAVLGAGPVCVAAGCTDLFPATQAKSLAGPVLDITAIKGLRGVHRTETGWRIGAATTWTDVIRADLPPAFDGLKLAAREVGSVQIQNAGTLVGNLCTASPAGDGVPCLLTLDASVEVQSIAGKRVLALSDFLKGARQTDLKPAEMVTAILIPEHAAQGQGHFVKLGARKYLIISIAMVGVRLSLSDGNITEAAIAVGACSAVAARLTQVEQALIGQRVGDLDRIVTQDLVAVHLSPIDDIRADAAYRLHAATYLVRRALHGAAV
jgi:CO/xanthine dehydrogenase FAD-binding subunit